MWEAIKTSFFGLVVLGMGVVLTVGMMREQAAERALSERGVSAEAVVTDGGMTHPKRGGTTYYVDLRYVVDGQTYEKLRITVPEEVYEQYVKRPEGGAAAAAAMVIRYLPEEPQRMMMVKPKVEVGNVVTSKWAWVVIAGALGYGGWAVCSALLGGKSERK